MQFVVRGGHAAIAGALVQAGAREGQTKAQLRPCSFDKLPRRDMWIGLPPRRLKLNKGFAEKRESVRPTAEGKGKG